MWLCEDKRTLGSSWQLKWKLKMDVETICQGCGNVRKDRACLHPFVYIEGKDGEGIGHLQRIRGCNGLST